MSQTELAPVKLQLIEQAVQSLFPNAKWTIQEPLGGGLSTSDLYKLATYDNTGKCDTYVVRISDPAHPHNNLEREYKALQLATEQKVAPQLYYADAQAGIVIMDFIENQPFDRGAEFMQAMAHLLRAVHRGRPFQKDMSLIDKTELLFNQIRPDLACVELVQNGVATMYKLAPLLQDPDDERPCHCDVNPGNVLFDGKRFWLIDWASAAQENFYFDLASCCNFYFPQRGAEEQTFLQHYFERSLTSQEVEKYERMRTFVAIFYGIMFVYLSCVQEGTMLTPQDIDALPEYTQFLSQMNHGKERLDNPLSQQRLGFIYLKSVADQVPAI